ncbi:glycosyltransferase family 4 protein [Pseudonocardia nigra]|uniref:glycosyltransferase family 4 protein n=1 Tax=Pseudonocardia nigra TaxID=1921578 RepID=UPI001C5E9D24|nr:glycosyltransferase family 4 protein [Pseudonocardia nigra]
MSGRRKIAFVEFTPSGGLFQFTAQLGEELARRGHEVHLFTGPRPELASRQPGFTVHPILPTWHPLDAEPRGRLVRRVRRVVRGGQLVVAWLVVLVVLRRARADVALWSSWPKSIDSLGVLAVGKLVPRTMLGIVAHEPRLMRREDSTAYKRGPMLDRVLPAAWRRVGVAFVLAEDARRRLLDNFEPRGPVIAIPHGDESALRMGVEVTPVARTAPVALFFGTWTAYKGIDVLLDAWPEVRRRVPDATLVLAGGVSGIDHEALVVRAEEVGGVEAHPGYVAREDVPGFFSRARVVVTPYIRASQSGVAHLAYTFDRPVVASAVGDIPDVVADGRTGLLVPPGDRAALAEALAALLADPVRAQEMGAAGARWLATEASWATVAERVEAGIEKAVHEGAAEGRG